jgi:thymidylate synthase
MHILKVRNVNQALPEGIDLLCRTGYERDSRYGRVIKMNCPVTTQYRKPWERCVFWPVRDWNPFLNLFEGIWLITGRNDVAWISQFAAKMAEFSDDGKTFHGGYGKRWRGWFYDIGNDHLIDQISLIIARLKANKDDRRCVLQMWDARADLGRVGVDVPCNTHIYFSVSKEGELDMTVCNRSNDILFGAYNTNSTCFSILQEYVAVGAGYSIGTYYQMSNDYHAYLNVFDPLRELANCAADPHRITQDPYDHEVTPTQVVDCDLKTWDEDLAMWMKDPLKVGIRSNFFKRIATPMFIAHKLHKRGNTKEAIELVETQMENGTDWKKATKEWLWRRVK